jgi:hypothetical protein
VPEAIARTLALSDAAEYAAARWAIATTMLIIGRGYNYATAFEIALKLKELAYVTAEPFSSADFMHGPIAVIQGWLSRAHRCAARARSRRFAGGGAATQSARRRPGGDFGCGGRARAQSRTACAAGLTCRVVVAARGGGAGATAGVPPDRRQGLRPRPPARVDEGDKDVVK